MEEVGMVRSIGGVPVLSTREVASRLGVSPERVRQLRKRGILVGIFLAGKQPEYVFRLEEVQALVTRRAAS